MRNRRERGGIVSGLMAFLGLLAASVIVLAVLIATRVHLTESRSRRETRVETPFGNLTVRERPRLDPSALGVPVYPGAQRLDDTRKLASFELDMGESHRDLTLAVAEYETPDSLAAVEAFYREHLGGARVKQGRRQRVVLEVEGGAVKKMVALRRHGAGTRISLASVTEAAAN